MEVYEQPTKGEENLKEQKATGDHLFELIIKSFDDEEVPIENIIGFGSDGCNVMFGEHDSVASRMKETRPGIYTRKCICHSMYICASKAAEGLPRMAEDLIRNIANYFSVSGKRQAEFAHFQSSFNSPIQKMLHPCQTRWLSLHPAVNRVVIHWDALLPYSYSRKLSEKTEANIVQAMQNDLIYLILLALDYLLPFFTNLNELMQSNEPLIATMHIKITQVFKELLKSVMDEEYVNGTSV